MKKKTVTIAIPAHNEEANIGVLLDSIAKQKAKNYLLEKVIIALDGCTDNTYEIVSSYKATFPQLTIINDGGRRGKGGRMNQMHRMNKSDILVSFDADGILKGKYVISELVKAFDTPKVGLVGGYNEPFEGKTFVERQAVAWINVWDYVRLHLPDVNTVHNHCGVVSALSKDLAKVSRYPKKDGGSDTYLYYDALRKGFEFRFAPRAVVNYRLPTTIKDLLLQWSRFLDSKHIIAEIFGNKIYKDWKISKLLKLRALVAVFLKRPVYLPMAFVFQIFLRWKQNNYIQRTNKGYWTIVTSTKSI